MISPNVFVQDVFRAAEAAPGSRAAWDKVWMYRDHTVVFDFNVYGHAFAMDLKVGKGGVEFWALARSEEGRRILRMALIGRYPMVKSNGERHLLRRCLPNQDTNLDDLKAESLQQVAMLSSDLRAVLHGTVKGASVEEGNINLFWWDKRPNFGDAIGPWIAARMSGKRPINGWGRWLDPAPLATVGSILDVVQQDGTQIWGTGLMNPLAESRVMRLRLLNDISVHAVRGARTAHELRAKLGWEVPDVYGDPALLLPRFLPVPSNPDVAAKIVVVPHYFHASYFADMTDADLSLVDVEQGLETVVQRIASAEVCISTSLHGIIIAQAYGVPWVWLRVEDHPLGGDTFKFEDFFTTLEGQGLSPATVGKQEISMKLLRDLATKAVLPATRVSLDALQDSFPRASLGSPAAASA